MADVIHQRMRCKVLTGIRQAAYQRRKCAIKADLFTAFRRGANCFHHIDDVSKMFMCSVFLQIIYKK
jgi:hypothetical protein